MAVPFAVVEIDAAAAATAEFEIVRWHESVESRGRSLDADAVVLMDDTCLSKLCRWVLLDQIDWCDGLR